MRPDAASRLQRTELQPMEQPPAARADGPELPRYRQIMDVLGDRIRDGAYPLGSFLPTEVELCAEFGVSRYTVREALRGLVERGMLARRQGSGSEVIASEPQRNYVHQVRTLADLFQYALDTHLDVQSMEDVTLTADEAEPLGGEAGERWLLIRSVRRVRKGGAPMSVTHSWIPGRLSWIRSEARDAVGPLYALIEARSGETITGAMQRIGAEAMSPSVAEALQRTPGSPCLRILRRYSSPQGTLIASCNWHPGDSFSYEMDLQLSDRLRG